MNSWLMLTSSQAGFSKFYNRRRSFVFRCGLDLHAVAAGNAALRAQLAAAALWRDGQLGVFGKFWSAKSCTMAKNKTK
jgi:hypothetical protein